MERPKKAFIREEWYQAISYLPPELRCQFYEGILSYVYNGSASGIVDPAVKGCFAMVKPLLENDCVKYMQAIVTNRQNGSNGGRPRGGQTEKNPTKPNQTQTNPIIHNTSTYTESEINFSLLSAEERESLFQKIFLSLWARGLYDAKTEAEKLINYYDARGWVDKGGNKIVKVDALAKVWKVSEGDYSPYFQKIRKKWALFVACLPKGYPEYIITQFSRMAITKEENRQICQLYVKGQDIINALESDYFEELKSIVKVWKCNTVKYCLIDDIQEMQQIKELTE